MPMSQTDRERLGLRGRVQQVTTEWIRDGGPRIEEQRFDRQGRLISLRIFGPDGREHCIRLDDERRAAGGTRRTMWSEDGSRVEVQDLTAANTWSLEGLNQFSFATWGAAVARTRYDSRGFPIEAIFEDARSRELHRIRCVCDEAGNILRAEQYGAESRSCSASVTFKYDDSGRVIEQETRLAGKRIHHTVTTYNDRGDIAKSVQDDKLARFEYRYDARENWIEKDASYAAPNPPVKCRRTIEYYDDEPSTSRNDS